MVVAVRQPGDRAEITATRAAAVIRVNSATGIGGMALTPGGPGWPDGIVLRLMHFRSLEGLTAANGRVHCRSFLGAAETEVSRFGPDRKPGPGADPPRAVDFPLGIIQRDGYIEVTLPPALWRDAPGTLRIEWVDAYR